MTTIIAIADPHVDATSVGGFDHEKGVHSNWVESCGRLNDSIDAANNHKASFFVIAGDLFDTGKPTAEAVAMVRDALKRLHKGCTAVIIDGNHDQQTVVAKQRTPIAAYFGDLARVVTASSPEVIDVDGMQFALAPWLRVSGKSKVMNTSEQLRSVVEDLSSQIKGGPSMFLGHLVTDECTFDNGMASRGSEMSMATTLLEAHIPTELLDAGAWSLARLGHIHKRQQLSDKTGYIGSPYKVSFGEYREAKGYDIITIDDKNKSTLKFGELKVRELVKVDLSIGGKDSITDIDKINEGDIVKIVVDHDGADSLDIKNAKAKLDRLGISNQIARLPKPKRTSLKRASGASIDTSPVDALKLYLERHGITDNDEVEAMIEELNSVMQTVGIKK
jgi:DNA repair exonuclease SbcCD nuclease subunit